MRVALVHDDLVQWGGAERVLLGISDLFPDAPIYTSVYDDSNSQIKAKFGSKKIVTSFLQKIPGWRNLYKALLPLYPLAFEQFDFSGYDLVISQTTRFAKSVLTKPETVHICYIHTPPRFLWNFSGSENNRLLGPLFSCLRVYDLIASSRVDYFLAGSKNCQERVKKVYNRDSQILWPFIDFERLRAVNVCDGGYFLVIARLNRYKRVDLAVNVFNKNGQALKIVGAGPELGNLSGQAKSNVEFVGTVSDELLISLLAGCTALIVTGEEDFGLVALEAQALGKPVIAYKKGGNLETVIEDRTGIFFNEQTEESLSEAVHRFAAWKFKPEACKKQASRFSREVFTRSLLKIVDAVISGN